MITYSFRFFPAAGIRHRDAGASIDRGRGGAYWSSCSNDANGGWRLDCWNESIYLNAYTRSHAMSVRCVAYES